MPVSLRDATPQDMPAVGLIAAAAFHPSKDALSRQLFPAHLQPKDTPDGSAAYAWRKARKTLSLGSQRSRMMVATDSGSGNIVGFALWEAPDLGGGGGETPSQSQSHQTHSDPEPPAALDQEAFAQMRRALVQEGEKIFGEAGLRDVWHLDYLAVDPSQQRRGIGRLLLDWGVHRAAAEGKDCYLTATSAGRPLYLAAGFEDVSIIPLCGVPHYSMVVRADKKP